MFRCGSKKELKTDRIFGGEIRYNKIIRQMSVAQENPENASQFKNIKDPNKVTSKLVLRQALRWGQKNRTWV